MLKTIKVELTINVEGSKLFTNMSMDNMEFLDDVVNVVEALDYTSNVIREKLRHFIEEKGDVHKEDWPKIPAREVLL